MNDTPDIATANEGMVKYWNSEATAGWVNQQEATDQRLSAVSDEIIARAKPQPGERAMDIGCGTGATSLRVADRVGPQGSVLGVDISAPMLELAQRRATEGGYAQLSFERADAQIRSFAPDTDLLVSRFGIMFFSDPVAAYANMLTALKPGGRMVFAAWGPAKDNPWHKIPMEAAIARLGRPEPGPPNAPGPLALADRDYALGIVSEAGFANPSVDIANVTLSAPGDLDALAKRFITTGPASRLLRQLDGDKEDEAAIVEAIRSGFTPYDSSDGVRVPATLNILSGVKPG